MDTAQIVAGAQDAAKELGYDLVATSVSHGPDSYVCAPPMPRPGGSPRKRCVFEMGKPPSGVSVGRVGELWCGYPKYDLEVD